MKRGKKSKAEVESIKILDRVPRKAPLNKGPVAIMYQ